MDNGKSVLADSSWGRHDVTGTGGEERSVATPFVMASSNLKSSWNGNKEKAVK